MLTLNEEQDQNWELAQQINRDARTDPDSPYAGKIIGILDGQIAVIGDTLDEVMQELMKREPDPWRRWVVEADTDCDTTYDIWRAD